MHLILSCGGVWVSFSTRSRAFSLEDRIGSVSVIPRLLVLVYIILSLYSVPRARLWSIWGPRLWSIWGPRLCSIWGPRLWSIWGPRLCSIWGPPTKRKKRCTSHGEVWTFNTGFVCEEASFDVSTVNWSSLPHVFLCLLLTLTHALLFEDAVYFFCADCEGKTMVKKFFFSPRHWQLN